MYKSTGTLRYGQTNLVLDIDPEIVRYYRTFLSRKMFTNLQLYPAHISIVRKEVPLWELWGKHAGRSIEFEYDGVIHHGTMYWWLNCWSKELEEIRTELGLPLEGKYFQAPAGYVHTWHITLGNTK